MYSQDKFEEGVIKAFGFSKDEANFTFKLFSDGASILPGSDIIEAVDKYRNSHPPATVGNQPPPSPQPEPISKPERVYESREPLTSKEQEMLVKRVKAALSQQKLNFEHLYRMADPDDHEIVSVIKLKATFSSMLPELPKRDLFELMKMLDADKNGSVDLAQYEAVMLTDQDDLKSIAENDSRVELSRSRMSSNQALDDSVSAKEESVHSRSGLSEGVVSQKNLGSDIKKHIGKLVEQLQKKEIRPQDVYSWVDVDNEGLVPTLKLLRELSGLVDMSKKEISEIGRYMDVDSNGIVSKGEYLSYVSGASALNQANFMLSEVVAEQALAMGNAPPRQRDSVRISSKRSINRGAHVQPIVDSKTVGKPSVIKYTKPEEKSVVRTIKQRPEPEMNPGRKFDLLSDEEFIEAVRNMKRILRETKPPLAEIFDALSIEEKGSNPQVKSKKKLVKRAPCLQLLRALQADYLKDFDKSKLRSIFEYIDKDKTGEINKEDFDLVFSVNAGTDIIDDSLSESVSFG